MFYKFYLSSITKDNCMGTISVKKSPEKSGQIFKSLISLVVDLINLKIRFPLNLLH